MFITHRLATARRADKVAMMENGVSPVSYFTRIRPSGAHTSLVLLSPLFVVTRFRQYPSLGRMMSFWREAALTPLCTINLYDNTPLAPLSLRVRETLGNYCIFFTLID